MTANIKGASLIHTLGILREVLGISRFQAIVAACPPRTQQLIRRTLVALEWIPLELWSPFLQAIFEVACNQDELQFRRLLRAVYKRDFTTLYRTHLQTTTPQTILQKTTELWSSYFDTGSMTLAPNKTPNETPGETASDQEALTVQLRDLETSFPLYTVILQAYLEQLMIMSGAPRCTVQRTHEQLAGGKLSCDYLVRLGA